MEIEASFLASPDVFLFIKSSESYAFYWLFSFGLSDHLVAAPVGQGNVAQDNIELLRLDNFQRALRGHRPRKSRDQNDRAGGPILSTCRRDLRRPKFASSCPVEAKLLLDRRTLDLVSSDFQ